MINENASLEVIQVFLSYSNKDKILAGKIKTFLEDHELQAFLAHEDIEPTHEWEGVIHDNLKSCDVFIPILSENFSDSRWTDQETGIAYAEGKLIIPLKINVDPYGFIGKIQALKIGEDVPDTCEKIFEIIKKSPKSEKLKNTVIKAFINSWSFNVANENASTLKEYEPFTENQINQIIRGYLNNDQISGGFKSKRTVKRLFKKYYDHIDLELKDHFEKETEKE